MLQITAPFKFKRIERNVYMSNLSKKSFAQPDELKTPPKTNAAVVKLGNITASKLTLEPGWKWSECVQPAVGGHS